MKDLLNQIETLTTSFMKDASSQLDKGNKAAGLRARRASLELEPLLSGSANCHWRLQPPAKDKISIRMFWQGHSLSTHYCGFHFTAIPNNRTISLLSGNLCARAWGFSLLSARGSRARVFFVTKLRLAVTAASDRLRLACVKKIRQPSAICAKSGIPYFFACHACLAPPVPSVLIVSKKITRTREAARLQTKGKKQTFLKHLKPF